ncbi:Hsp20/alpha crystallin family protein [Methylobacter psychrophilus]|uniref:Hsp20/alpha crystallin family protein n=1 Tax=Methylobacter psychrophilus TaxID=96941 RepID=UPI0021D4D07B|nr:Hsp20/alpha crystallin family protein [Methylobacter psychrophilus]
MNIDALCYTQRHKLMGGLMIKNPIIIAIATVLVIVLGIQSYVIFNLNESLKQFSAQENSTDNPKAQIPKLPKPGSDNELFKDQLWNPYEEMQRMQNEMEQLFGDSFSRFHLNAPLGSLSKIPDVDLQEKPDQYIVTVNAPGADESSIDVKLEDQVLNISIKTEHAKDETDAKKGKYQYRERFVGQFQRALTLPGPANAAKMTTKYDNGVLTVTIPKT